MIVLSRDCFCYVICLYRPANVFRQERINAKEVEIVSRQVRSLMNNHSLQNISRYNFIQRESGGEVVFDAIVGSRQSEIETTTAKSKVNKWFNDNDSFLLFQFEYDLKLAQIYVFICQCTYVFFQLCFVCLLARILVDAFGT